MVFFHMVSSKSPFLPRSRPQTPDSPSLPKNVSHSFRRLVDTSYPYFITSFFDTLGHSQTQFPQPLAHTFRHIGGVRRVVCSPFTCHSHKKHPVCTTHSFSCICLLSTSHHLLPTISFRIRTYEKLTRNPFRIRTSKTQHLKSFRIRTYEKTPGGWGMCAPSPEFAARLLAQLRKHFHPTTVSYARIGLR